MVAIWEINQQYTVTSHQYDHDLDKSILSVSVNVSYILIANGSNISYQPTYTVTSQQSGHEVNKSLPWMYLTP